MKKHAGKFLYAGIMVSVFGLLIMAAVSLATGTILGHGADSGFVKNVVSGATDTSWNLIVFGVCLLVISAFMFTRSD